MDIKKLPRTCEKRVRNTKSRRRLTFPMMKRAVRNKSKCRIHAWLGWRFIHVMSAVKIQGDHSLRLYVTL